MKNFLLLFFFLISTSAFANDILGLKSGKFYSGKVKAIDYCLIEFKVETGTFLIPMKDVEYIQFKNRKNKKYKKYVEILENESSIVQTSENCIKGTLDAEKFHGKKGKHILFGILFGGFATLGSALFGSPSVEKDPDTLLYSENRELFNDFDYLRCYKKKAKSSNTMNTLIGWGIWLGAFLLFSQ